MTAVLRWAWRQLTSMRTALVLLLLLAVASVPGSVFPQRRVDPDRVEQYLGDHATSGPWLDRLGMFDVYASPWFAAVYLLLFTSLVGCVLPRARRHVRELRAGPPRVPRRLERLSGHGTRRVDAGPDTVLDRAERALRGQRYRVLREPGALRAERGYSAEAGNLAFHLSLLALLVVVALGAASGWSGQALVVEGQGFSNTVPMYDTFRPGARVDAAGLPPFSFTLEEFRVRYGEPTPREPGGVPGGFEAVLLARDDPGAPARRESLRVNHPLTFGAARVFLVGNGYAPMLTVHDAEGEPAFTGPVPFLPLDAELASRGVVKVPDARPRQLALTGFLLPTAAFDDDRGPVSLSAEPRSPRLVLTAFAGDPGEDDLGLDDGRPRSVYVLDDSRLTRLLGDDGDPVRLLLAPGDTVRLPDGAGTVTFDGLRRYAVLDVRSDPTKGWVLLAALTALGGLMLMLSVRRRRIWLRVDATGDGRTVVEAAGLAPRLDPGLAEEVGRFLDAAARHGSGDEE